MQNDDGAGIKRRLEVVPLNRWGGELIANYRRRREEGGQ